VVSGSFLQVVVDELASSQHNLGIEESQQALCSKGEDEKGEKHTASAAWQVSWAWKAISIVIATACQ